MKSSTAMYADVEAEHSLWWHFCATPDIVDQVIPLVPAEGLSLQGMDAHQIWSRTSTDIYARRREFRKRFTDIASKPATMGVEQAIARVRGAFRRATMATSSTLLLDALNAETPDANEIRQHVQEIVTAESSETVTTRTLKEQFGSLVQHWRDAAAGKVRPVPLGLGLDRYRIMQPGKLVIIGARPGNCKTTFALNAILCQLEAGYHVSIHCREMSEVELLQRLVSIKSGVSYERLDKGQVDANIVAQSEWISNAPLDLACGKCLPNVGHIERWARDCVRRGSKVIWLDYLQQFKHDQVGVKLRERRLEVADISRRFKDLSQELAVPIVCLAQLNRDAHDSEPTISQLKEAGDIEQDADSILLLDLPRGGKRTYTIMLDSGKYDLSQQDLQTHLVMALRKNRNGPGGVEVAYFDGPTMGLFTPRL